MALLGSDFAATHPDTAARVVVRAYEGGGDTQNAWDVLTEGVGASAARSYVRSATHPTGLFYALMAHLGVPADADLACANCGASDQSKPPLYSRPHDRADKPGTPCKYVRFYSVHFLERDIVDGDFPRDDTRESVTDCSTPDTDFDETVVSLAVEAITRAGLRNDGVSDWFSSPDGTTIVNHDTGERSEDSAHLYGFTQDETAAIFAAVGQ